MEKLRHCWNIGTRFNPEFTGRENVFINGAVMGLTRQQIENNLPEIESFSELGEFIHHPFKTYSSGMYIRLAFAAAIHVDPEILILNEALAVGEAKFQAKCFRKFRQFRNEDKTILFVTHDTNAIVRYCDQAILLDHGQLLDIDSSKSIVNQYLELLHSDDRNTVDILEDQDTISKNVIKEVKHIGYREETTITTLAVAAFMSEIPAEDKCSQRNSYNLNEHRWGNGNPKILDFLIICNDQVDPSTIYTHDEISIFIKVAFHESTKMTIYGLSIKTLDGV